MSYRIYRREPDGTRQLIGWAEDLAEAGLMIEEDRKDIDYEIGYDLIAEEEREAAK